jgi:transcriptional regulator with XRE-family HTH domain
VTLKHPGRPPHPAGAEGLVLCRLRKAAGLTQFQAAKLSGISTRTYGRWEIGAHHPNRSLFHLTIRMIQRAAMAKRKANP